MGGIERLALPEFNGCNPFEGFLGLHTMGQIGGQKGIGPIGGNKG